jgi:hypothetical protein
VPKCFAPRNDFLLLLGTSPPARERKEGGFLSPSLGISMWPQSNTIHSTWILMVLVTLAFLSSQKPPDTVLSGSMADLTSLRFAGAPETTQKFFPGLSLSLSDLEASQ